MNSRTAETRGRTASHGRLAAGAVALLLAAAQPVRADSLWDVLRMADPGGKATAVAGPRVAQRIGGPLGSALDRMSRQLADLGRRTNSEIKVQGQHSLGFHMEQVDGSRDSYDNSTYYGRRAFGGGYASTDLTLSGRLMGVVNFETRYSNSVYGNPYDNRLSLNYATKELKVDAGDIQGGFQGNTLVDFSRALKGVQVSATVARGLRLSTLYSQTKAQTRTITINGANRSGPYYVFAGMMVADSEHVRVNNRDMLKGTDYTLDPYTGELNFLKGLIVGELDVIAVTFETYGYNQSAGVLTGWRADIRMLRNVRSGFTYLAQTGTGVKETASKTEQFYGYNNPASPYVLELPVDATVIKDTQGKVIGIIPNHPMVVTVGTIPQVYGTDFQLDPLLPNRVYFKLPIPSTQIVKITYVPVAANDSPGDRSVLGFDTSVQLGKLGSVTAEVATSRVGLGASNQSGGAWQLRGDMKFARDRLNWNWNVRNIGSTFTTIESPGFRRNERGLTMGLNYRVSDKLRLTGNLEQTKRPAYDYTTTGASTSVGLDDYNMVNLGASWQLGKSGQLTLQHNGNRTLLAQGGRSDLTSDTLAFTISHKAVGADISIGRNVNTSTMKYTAAAGGADTLTSYGTDSLATRLGLHWRASQALSLDGNVSNSQMRNLDGRHTTAQDLQLTARTNPLRAMTLTLTYGFQNSGSSSVFGNTSGTTTGGTTTGGTTPILGGGINNGIGGYGNYSGGLGNGATLGNMSGLSYGGASRGLNVNINYQPIRRISMDFAAGTSTSIGDYLYNSKRSDVSFTTTYSVGERMSMSGTVTHQVVQFVGAEGGTASTMIFLSLRGKPYGKLTTALSCQIMRSSSNMPQTSGTTTAYSGGTNLGSYSLRLEYPLFHGHNVFWQFDNADSSGYLASTQRTMALGVAFGLTQNVQFTLGYRNQSFLSRDGTASGNFDYSVHSIDCDLGLRF